jgi:hypothetical protein
LARIRGGGSTSARDAPVAARADDTVGVETVVVEQAANDGRRNP